MVRCDNVPPFFICSNPPFHRAGRHRQSKTAPSFCDKYSACYSKCISCAKSNPKTTSVFFFSGLYLRKRMLYGTTIHRHIKNAHNSLYFRCGAVRSQCGIKVVLADRDNRVYIGGVSQSVSHLHYLVLL